MECALLHMGFVGGSTGPVSTPPRGSTSAARLSGLSPARRLFDMKDTDREQRLRRTWSRAATVESGAPPAVVATATPSPTETVMDSNDNAGSFCTPLKASTAALYGDDQDLMTFELLPGIETDSIEMITAFDDIGSDVASFFSDENALAFEEQSCSSVNQSSDATPVLSENSRFLPVSCSRGIGKRRPEKRAGAKAQKNVPV
ncbi:hypothetical protein FVE85_6261 [Porphyridium purpureum]|uniref:Uncharacterized protein n=1 Tax=Porphyridium purpureum TaxID=35688 RepID=A0A5J4Z4S7_PORPP|nr:hypothetical protein FVE85_6261 [Porphyridium purpureum]|eukprot:POR0254..scf295_1